MSTKSRRLRKKLYLDEFAILGFEFTCNLNATEEEFDLLLDELLEFINKRKLCIAGGGDCKSFSGFICSVHRYGSATNQDREEVELWLKSKENISNIVVSQLVDANYGV